MEKLEPVRPMTKENLRSQDTGLGIMTRLFITNLYCYIPAEMEQYRFASISIHYLIMLEISKSN